MCLFEHKFEDIMTHSEASDIQEQKERFLKFLLRCKVLKFGNFTTKSGRKTPYFINTGEYRTGEMMLELSRHYAQAICRDFPKGSDREITNLFGPAYKGIPLAVGVSMVLHSEFDYPVSYTYNRKEAKDHGEGGSLVGESFKTKQKVLIIEDVITAGTSLRETMELLEHYPAAQVTGLLVSVDRREKTESQKTALQEAAESYGIQTSAIASIDDIITWLENRSDRDHDLLQKVRQYRLQYGVE